MRGKTYSLMQHANWTARQYRNCRIWFVRKTRKSLNDSVLKDWESKILYPGHPAIVGTAQREHRDKYVYPNGAEIGLVGLDSVDRVMSAQVDRFYLFEATEATQDDFEKLISRLRNGMTPYHQAVLDCNPQSAYHWINQRAEQIYCSRCGEVAGEEGVTVDVPCMKCGGMLKYRMERLRYRHQDNPILHDGENWTEFGNIYLKNTLGSLTGARKERLLYHRWCSEEGVIWEEFDPVIHVVSRDDIPEMKWHFGSMDFGFRAPGVLQVWGVDGEDRIWMVAEVYKAKKQLDWWAEKIESLDKEYSFTRIVGDCAEPRTIEFLNDRLSSSRDRKTGGIVLKSDKTKGKIHGLDMVRWGLSLEDHGPRVFFVRDCLRFGLDQDLRAASRPVSTVQEIPSYAWRKTEEGKIEKDEPDPNSIDHGCDALIYACVWKWGKNLTREEQAKPYDWDSFGAMLKHNDVTFEPF